MLIVTPILQELSASQCSCPPCAVNADRELLFSVLCCDDTNLFGWQQQPKYKSDQQESGHIAQ